MKPLRTKVWLCLSVIRRAETEVAGRLGSLSCHSCLLNSCRRLSNPNSVITLSHNLMLFPSQNKTDSTSSLVLSARLPLPCSPFLTPPL